jgi:hypothetical protein
VSVSRLGRTPSRRILLWPTLLRWGLIAFAGLALVMQLVMQLVPYGREPGHEGEPLHR